MTTTAKILDEIKSTVLEIIPDAVVMLFGSRATGNWHEESDWDVLILTETVADKKINRKVQENLFELSLNSGAFIQFIISSKEEWKNGIRYYSLQQTIADSAIIL